VPRLVFPILGTASYTNDFGAPRPSGGHQGNDMMAAKRTPVVAVESGRVVKHTSSRNAGCMLYLYGKSGTTYMYIHLNNDKTLRNDNRGRCRNGIAFAPGLASNQWVRAGQLIAFVGDSGDANGIASHLHFEVHPNGGRAVSPYKYLRRAYHYLYARPAEEQVATMQMRIRGTVVETFVDLDPQAIRVRVKRVILSNGWVTRPARNVILSLEPDAVVRRAVAPRTYEAVTLEAFASGDDVAIWTPDFANTRGAAYARSGRHTIRDILLRLTT
jgi:hypothetical protein